MAEKNKTQKKKHRLRLFMVFLLLFAMTTGLALYAATPTLLRWAVQGALASATGHVASVESVTYDWDREITAQGVSLQTVGGGKAGDCQRCTVKLKESPWSGFGAFARALGGRVEVESVLLSSPVVTLERRDGRWNWERSGGGTATGSPAVVFPGFIQVEHGQVDVRLVDQKGDCFPHSLKDIALELRYGGGRYHVERADALLAGGVVFMQGWFSPSDGTYQMKLGAQDTRLEDLLEESPDGEKPVAGRLLVDVASGRPMPEAHVSAGGKIRVDGAKIWEITLFNSILTALTLGGSDDLGALKEVEVTFFYDGSTLRVVKGLFISPTLSFFGHGTIDARGVLDLWFIPKSGKKSVWSAIPVLGDVTQNMVDRIQKNMVQVHVTGTLFQPESNVEPLGDLKTLGADIGEFLSNLSIFDRFK